MAFLDISRSAAVRNPQSTIRTSLAFLLLLGAGAPLPAADTGAVAGATSTNVSRSARPDAGSLFGNEVIAEGKGVKIMRGDLDSEVVRVRAAAAAQGNAVPLPPDLEQEVLQGLISKQLILDLATPADRAKGKEQYESVIQKIKTAGKITDAEFEQRLKPQLQLMGISREEWEKQNIDQATLPIVVERVLKITATDDQAKKFYADNPAQFEQPEMVRVAYILLTTRDAATGAPISESERAAKQKKLEDILKHARSGEDFSKLAKTYSEDASSKDEGGELPPFGRARPGVPAEFEAAAFSLNTNQVSDIVTTPAGLCILKLYEKIPAKKIALDDKTMSDIKDYLMRMDVQKQLPDFVMKLRKDANVQILDEKLKSAESSMGGSIPAPGAGGPAK